jgi:hypothetical protein
MINLAAFALLATSAPQRASLRVGLISFTYPPWTTRDAATGAYTGGFMVEFYREMGVVGGFDIEFVPLTDPNYFNDFTKTTIKYLDAGLIDLAFDVNTSLTAGYLATTPFLMFDFMLLTRKTTGAVDTWQVFAPFSSGLWAAFGGAVLFGAFVMQTIANIDAGRPLASWCSRGGGGGGSGGGGAATYTYHALAALLGGDEYDLYHVPRLGLGRLYRLGLLFLVLVFGATYTANLAAFLTKPTFTLHGPQSVAELRHATVCSRWPGIRVAETALWFRRVRYPPASLTVAEREPWARAELQAGACDAVLEMAVNAKAESLRFCDTMHLVPGVGILPVVDYNLMRGGDLALWRNVSSAILATLGRPAYTEMLARNMRFDQSCPAAGAAETSKITVERMSGAFFVFFCCGVLAIACTAAARVAGVGGAVDGAPEKPTEEVQNAKLDAKLNAVLAELKVLREEVRPAQSGEQGLVPAGGGGGGTTAKVKKTLI